MTIIGERTAQLADFFRYLFSADEGYLCIATTRPPSRRDTFGEQYYQLPDQLDEAVEFCERVTPTHNVYFGVNLYSVPRRKKDNTIPQNLLWADLDTCNPKLLEIPPQCVIESSPARFQAIWKLDQKVDPRTAENYSKRIAYAYADKGADKSGWDLTQLMRVPGTYNYKYELRNVPAVRLVARVDDELPVAVFESLPQPSTDDDEYVPSIPVPDLRLLPSAEAVLYRYQSQLQTQGLANTFAKYYTEEPIRDWSGALWRLLLLCFEVGMSGEEAFVIATTSKCNKYARDGRPETHLWREVLKAESERRSVELMLASHPSLTMPILLSTSEEDKLGTSLIDDYKSWATEATDAVPDFHELCCTMLMSIFMSTTLHLKTTHSAIRPNLWGMILGESTLTRKTTAMDMAMSFVHDINPDLILASDASPEGLLNALSTRPKQVSIFYRDEVTGFFNKIATREHMADMQETMTKMYDVPRQLTRRLRKDTYIVSEPIFIFLGGGTPDKMYTLLDDQSFASGFIPRFLVMRGFGDSASIRPTGPPISTLIGKREVLRSTFAALNSIYTDEEVVIKLHDGQHMSTKPEYDVIFPNDVWERAAEIEVSLLKAAQESAEAPRALPMFARMFVSMLKMTCLFAAARHEPKDFKIHAELADLLQAAFYIQKWGKYAVDLVTNSGMTTNETHLMGVYRQIERHPGIIRSDVMRYHRLDARIMQLFEDTLVQRHMITVHTKGKGKQYWPIGR